MLYRRAAMVVVLTTMAGVAVRAADTPPPPLATADEVKQMVDGGKYREALKELLRILALKGPAAQVYDRYDMLMLKAESQLQLRQKDAVLLTLGQARDEALAEKKPDRWPAPVAMMELVSRSPTYAYRGQKGGAVVSILDRDKRGEAMAALLTDELPPVQVKIGDLAKVTAMGPVVEASKIVGKLRAIELSASGATAETGELARAVRGNAYRLMEPVVEDMAGHTELIAKHANEVITDNLPQIDMNSGKSWMQQVTHLRGPSGEERRSLNEIVATSDKMITACHDVEGGLQTEFEALDEIAGKAEEVKKSAKAVLEGDYTSPVKKPQ